AKLGREGQLVQLVSSGRPEVRLTARRCPPWPDARHPPHGGTMNKQTAMQWAEKQVFTTGEVAEICNVSQQTIIRCFDSGRLQGFRVPGSRFRRIPRAELLRF